MDKSKKVKKVYDQIRSKTKKKTVEAKELLEASRKESSLLYDYFEWDDEKCGEKHRLQQAREMINYVIPEPEDEEEVGDLPLFDYVETEDEEGNEINGYMPRDEIADDKQALFYICQDALSRIIFWEKKYGHYKDLKKVINNKQLVILEKKYLK